MERELTALQNLIDTSMTFVVQYGFQFLGAIIILVLGLQAAKWASRAVTGLCERRGIDVTLGRFFGNVARVLVLVFVVIIALGKFGITIAPFIAALGAVAFGSSLALQGPLSNYGAGLSIILGRPFVVGNTITVLGVAGVVEEVRLAATVLSTEDGEQITIPNKQIVGEILHNSFENKIVEETIGLSYDDEPARAVAAIRAALGQVEGVCKEPPPQIGIDGFSDSSVQLGVRFWVPTARYFQVKYQANDALLAAIRDSGLTVPYPRRLVSLESSHSGED